VIGLDTNVLVRYLAADDPGQTRTAVRIIEDARQREEPLFLASVVLCETVWVLDRSYGQPKENIVAILEQILQADLFVVDRDDLVRRSLEEFRDGKGDFADYMIGNIAREAGCSAIVTFDRALAGSPGFKMLR
jgi:predicted nucleic-acid-binding protein